MPNPCDGGRLVRMAYQFAHVEGYARAAGRGKKGGNSVAGVVAEAEREPGYCHHVEAPQEPTLLYGVRPSEAGRMAVEWAEAAKDARGHALRKDGLCLLGGVISLPRAMEERWEPFSKDALKWLKKEYGPRLRSVISHNDEAHPHIHFFVVPKPGERFEEVHDGIRAMAAANPNRGDRDRSAAQKTLDRKAGGLAFVEAMRAWQDRFWEGVARRYGLARLGPRRQKLTRAEWKAREAEARRLAAEDGRLETLQASADERYEQALAIKAGAGETVERVKAEAGALVQAERARAKEWAETTVSEAVAEVESKADARAWAKLKRALPPQLLKTVQDLVKAQELER